MRVPEVLPLALVSGHLRVQWFGWSRCAQAEEVHQWRGLAGWRLVMDFVISKKDFDAATKQILFGRKATSAELVDLTTAPSTLILVAMGTSIEVPIVCETTGSVSISVGDLARLKKISATYKAGPIRICITEGRIRFQNTSISASIVEKKIARRVIDIPSDAGAMDLLSLQLIFSVDEIEDCGLHTKLLEARERIARMLDSAASGLREYGFTRSELSAMAETKLKAHAETMRKALFPSENS